MWWFIAWSGIINNGSELQELFNNIRHKRVSLLDETCTDSMCMMTLIIGIYNIHSSWGTGYCLGTFKVASSALTKALQEMHRIVW